MTKPARIALKALVWLLALAPGLRLGWALLRQDMGILGVNPIQALTWATGWWTLMFLTLTLALTPLQRLTGRKELVPFRRLVGLFAFGYGTAHLLTYLWLDQFWDLGGILKDVAKRPFITVGMAAWAILLALAVTSTKGWVKRLGRRWKPLHRLVYLAAVLGILHFAWKEKVGFRAPRVAAFGAAVAVLLLARLAPRRKLTAP